MSGYQSVPKVDDPEGGGKVATTFTFHTEWVRFYAYLAFWGMCLFAIIVTSFAVKPYLGPCPAYEGAEPTYGMHCSVLMDTFGFNNICVNWDYSPSREATALVYPLFEYSIILYIVLEYLQKKNDFENNKFSEKYMSITTTLFWIKIVLVAWFRMIFVCSVFQEPIAFFGTEMPAVVAHTLGFFGMQFGLILIAFENVFYIWYTGGTMWCFSVDMTKYMSVAYMVLLTFCTCFKISWASSIFIWGEPWVSEPWPAIADRTWMVLAALFPLFFALNGTKTEPPMTITIKNE